MKFRLGSPWFADDLRARGFFFFGVSLLASVRPTVTLACIQFEPAIARPDDNLNTMAERVRAAAADGANLIVLPELADSGYMFESEAELAEVASPIPDGKSARFLITLAQVLRVTIVCGLAEQDGDAFYNSAIICGPDGYIGRYRKLHLWNREKLFFQPGDLGLPVFDTPVGRIGLMICYDGWFPEAFRHLALNGAEIICIPTNWVPIAANDAVLPPMATILHVAAAHSNAVYIACADRIGTERGQAFIGSSLIVGPTGAVLAGPASRDAEASLIATVSLADLNDSRKVSERNDVQADRRPDVYGQPNAIEPTRNK